MHHNFEARREYASELLQALRFTKFRPDFLLDVVKKEGEAAYSEEVI